MDQRLSLITLGVEDLAASTRFYREVLGWTPAELGGGSVTFFQLNGFILGLFPRTELARISTACSNASRPRVLAVGGRLEPLLPHPG